MKKRKLLRISVFIILLSLFMLVIGENGNTAHRNDALSDYEHNYFVIKEQVQRKYSLESRHINILSRDIADDISFVLFTFTDEPYGYIGNLSVSLDPLDDEKIRPENILSLSVYPINDLMTPFTVLKSTMTKDSTDYCLYFGWINDMQIREIDFNFYDDTFIVQTNGSKYYSLLRNSDQKTVNIAGTDFMDTIIHEYIY